MNRLKEFDYAIREIAVLAEKVAKSGKRVFYLNIGDPVLFDFKTPKYYSQAIANASLKGKNFYVDSLGVPELRAELSTNLKQLYNINASIDNIVITAGVSEAIFFLLAGLIENKNEILIPGPSYPLYINYTKFFGGVPVEYELDEFNDWEPNIEDMRKKISNRTRALLICSPNNPTGIMYSENAIKKIVDIAGEYNLPIISDEIYDQIVYDKTFTCPASLSNDVSVIGLNGFSKSHLATGWRLGYMYYHDPENKLHELKEAIAKLARARLSASSIAQYAAIEILQNPGNHTQEMVQKLKQRRDYSYSRLRKIEGVNCVKPNGAFYFFPKFDLKELGNWNNDKELVRDLLEKTGICGVYGSGFGDYGKDHVRFTFLPNIETLEIVYNLLQNFLT